MQPVVECLWGDYVVHELLQRRDAVRLFTLGDQFPIRFELGAVKTPPLQHQNSGARREYRAWKCGG
jgi:hypothetical protein